MYTNNTINRLKKTGILLSIIFGIMLISSVDVDAQWRDNRNNRRGGYSNYNNSAAIAQRHGYQDGLKDGADDSRDRDRYRPQSSGDYKKGTNGYESRFGNKNAYKQAYRTAYIRGYQEGYQRNNRGRNGRRNRGY